MFSGLRSNLEVSVESGVNMGKIRRREGVGVRLGRRIMFRFRMFF